MDTKTREVLAMVGSHDFFDKASAGQVNGTLSARSPWFNAQTLYLPHLLSMPDLLPQQTLLFDVPVDFAGYSPVNYDEKYTGYVTAREALARSLNVPAVNVYAKMEKNRLYQFLKQAGISTLNKSGGLRSVARAWGVRYQSATINESLCRLGKYGRICTVSSPQGPLYHKLSDGGDIHNLYATRVPPIASGE